MDTERLEDMLKVELAISESEAAYALGYAAGKSWARVECVFVVIAYTAVFLFGHWVVGNGM